MDAALRRPIRMNRPSLVEGPSPRPNFKDNQRQTDLFGLKDKEGHWFCFCFDYGDCCD
jgi:hypothetical protein